MRSNDQKSIRLARRLCVDQTDAETVLWNRIRNRRMDGNKFVRQEPIIGFICDFVCREKRLIIEVDGGQHNESAADAVRDERLREKGYKILRFWNNDVLGNIDGVLRTIQTELADAAPHPTLSP
ncbi:endonuclease domain-containing protein [Bradyrhizobium sp. CCGUVB23]|uniref:endonuclease domain-containing protein n=1 Tax=Bradyrhizobium sp. CCGUVB23 TaxID=2949630 RepID=UPI0020B408A6|nr:endonuclease domain-containing protein [Bradyrhizobium sp. CCGUVB23]MCP3463965.1 endonuclease domain-containing protein [Bradyrhizobium sp. CCGUVB23]